MMKRKTPLPFPESGSCLRYYRELRGYTQEQLAEMVGMAPSYYGYIERGRQMATIAYFYKLSQVLCVPIEALLLPEYREQEEDGLKGVLMAQIGQLTPEECKIKYELLCRIVPMIREQQIKSK